MLRNGSAVPPAAGMARSNVATRAIRESRSSRTKRRTDALPMNPPLFAVSNTMNGIIQVSITIKETNAQSNKNHGSRKANLLQRKAKNRMLNSERKTKQKVFSAIWKIGSASVSTVASFWSVSIAIHDNFLHDPDPGGGLPSPPL